MGLIIKSTAEKQGVENAILVAKEYVESLGFECEIEA